MVSLQTGACLEVSHREILQFLALFKFGLKLTQNCCINLNISLQAQAISLLIDSPSPKHA